MLIDGAPRPRSRGPALPPRARRSAWALIPEDRKTEGLMLPMSVGDNLSSSPPSIAFRAAGSSIAAAEGKAIAGDDQAPRPSATAGTNISRRARSGLLRRQPAEGGHRQMADGQPPHHPC